MSTSPRFSDGDGGETLADGTAVGLPGSHGERSRFEPGELRRVLDAFPLATSVPAPDKEPSS